MESTLLSKQDDCLKIEKAFLVKFGKLPDVRYYDGYFCLWKQSTMCEGVSYYKLSQQVEYAISFINTILLMIPSAISVFETQGEKRNTIVMANQLEMNRLFEQRELFEELS